MFINRFALIRIFLSENPIKSKKVNRNVIQNCIFKLLQIFLYTKREFIKDTKRISNYKTNFEYFENFNLLVDPITRTFRAKSMQHWCLFNMSNPRSISIGCSSKIENEDVKKSSLIWICAMWTRPMIFWVPTPLAIPAHLLSTNRMILHLSAAAWDIIVAWAPESTKLEVIICTVVIR